MIEAMRSKAASWIAKILALFLILSFAVWGIGDMVPGQGVTQTVATLDDVKIEKDLIVNKLQSSVNVMRAALGPQFDNRQAVKLGFLERALDEIIEETLLQKELDNLKLEVGESTIRRAIYDDPRFKGTGGSIDRRAFQNFLRQEGISESQFISILRNQIKKNQLLSAYTSGIEAPDILVEKLSEYGSEKRIAEIVTIPYRKANSISPPDLETLKKFYQENKIRFRTPEYRDITAIYLDPKEFGKSITPPSDKVRESFEALKASASLPERRDFSQILILSDESLNQVQNGFKTGKTFEQVSKDATGKPPQALGALSKNEMLPTIAEAAFKLTLNEVTKPIKTALGWHILRLNKVEAARIATLEDLRPKIIEELKREIATDEIIQITGRIDDKIAAGLTLEDAASAVGINVVKFSRVDSVGNTMGGVRVAGLPKSRRFLDLTTQLEPGENSAIEEANDGSYFVLRVDRIYEPKIPKIKDVQEQAIFAWKQNQVQKYASEQATKLLALAKVKGLDQVAKAQNLQLRKTQPFTRSNPSPETKISDELSSALFKAKENELVMGPNIEAFSVARVLKIIKVDVDRKSADFAATKKSISQSISQDLVRQLISELKKNSDITVNRQVLQRIKEEQLGG